MSLLHVVLQRDASGAPESADLPPVPASLAKLPQVKLYVQSSARREQPIAASSQASVSSERDCTVSHRS